jgi:hypothetical protein
LLRNQNKNKPEEVEEAFIDLIPESEIKDVEKFHGENSDCIVCLNSFQSGDLVTTLPCSHVYHSKCIKDWLKTNPTCPVCKYEITKENFK